MTEDMKNKGEYSELEVVNVRLVKEPSLISETPVRTSEAAAELVKDMLSQFVFCILNLASDGKPISMNVVSIGTITQAFVSPRDVFKSSILSNAAAFLAFHCHPSGNPTPSRTDAVTTQRLKEARELLEIRMIDHLVVGCGSGKSFSFRGESLFDGDVVKNYNRFKAEKEQER